MRRPGQGAPVRGAPVRGAPVRGAPVRGAPGREAPGREAPVREAPGLEAPVREAPVLEAPVLGLLLVVLLAGCGIPVDSEPRRLDPAAAPFRVFDQQPPDAHGDGRVALYFVRNDRVVLQPRAVERSTDIRALLDLLLEGPTPQQVAAGTRSALPTAFTVEDVTVGPRGIAVVTLGPGAAQVGTSPLGFAQIVATLTAPGRARSVRFRLDGQDIQVPRGDGSLTYGPLDRDDYAELLALPSPAPAAASPGPATPAASSSAPAASSPGPPASSPGPAASSPAPAAS